jgi:DNA sulfur modification protein DndD
MILKTVTIRNFKQFYDSNTINFNTQGKITVVYGFNGFGKTRLHSFFNWLFYGKDRDNENIYNKPMMDKLFIGDVMVVSGELEFEHNNISYILLRTEEFKKNNSRVTSYGSVLKLRYLDDNKNWRTVVLPEKEISKILPNELSQYFFFDGEGMLSELLGKTSSRRFGTNLKDAINTIFGLKIYENAIKDISSGKVSAVFELSKQLKDTKGKNKPQGLLNYISNFSEEIEDSENTLKELEDKINFLNDRNQELSSKIGQATNKISLEKTRSNNKKLIDRYRSDIDNYTKKIGYYSTKTISYLLVSKNITDSQKILSKKADENYVSGLTRPLIENLLKEDTCICGNKISENERKKLENLLDYLPPKSYKSVFLDYQKSAKRRLESADLSLKVFDDYMIKITEKRVNIMDLEQDIDDIDKQLESIKNVEPYVNERKDNEKEILRLNGLISRYTREIAEKNIKLKGAKQQLRDITKNSNHNRIIQEKIDFLESICDTLRKEYNKKKLDYKVILENNIKSLANNMLSVNRNIKLLDNYTLSVTDDSNNHILSEGQAAIITFSYIGGILNSLKSLDVEYVSSEYPLILDAPLSKLDIYHIEKVFEHLPSFSNQIVIFSKERIDQYITDEDQNHMYQIMSNKQANQAVIGKYIGKDYFSNLSFRELK